MAKLKILCLAIICVTAMQVFISGCAEIDPFETPAEVIRHPLGTESIRVGMSKDEVISKWGEPDLINARAATDASRSQGEEWVYKARSYTPVPLDAGYLQKNKYLYFDGNNLVIISDSPR
ncbi:MAG: hypothetical protein JW800_04760 [Candidatus Omnitrophica bacterium]|nr:hypothetical protein [Candidatus Omnitrophota bacterium]